MAKERIPACPELEAKGRWGQLKKIITRPTQSPAQGGLRIALIYAAVGALWMIFSDLAVDLIIGQSRAALVAQTVKGWVFVGASAVLIYLLINRTISSIKESEKALADGQKNLSTLFENLPGMLYRCGGEDCLLDLVSPGAVELTGYSISELSQKRKLNDLIVEEDREMVRSNTEDALALQADLPNPSRRRPD